MRELNQGKNRFTKVVVLDEPGEGGACHEYGISRTEGKHTASVCELGRIVFQNGPIKEKGVNGCHQEDLLAIVIDRLERFQAGDFACGANQSALEHIRLALIYLNNRTQDRIARAVEGTSQA